jgi:hypothetical protein
MHGSTKALEDYKRELILQYVIPAFNGLVSNIEEKLNELVKCCHLQTVIRHQRLEAPGPALMGFLWFSIAAMSHSYFYNEEKNRESGTIIYKRRQFIFNADSLLYGLERPDYVQILEPGEVLGFRYQDVLALMSKYTDINQAIRVLAAKQGIYLRQRIALLQMKSLERVRWFRKENEAFLNCSSQEIQAMHVNLGLRAYIDTINKLR